MLPSVTAANGGWSSKPEGKFSQRGRKTGKEIGEEERYGTKIERRQDSSETWSRRGKKTEENGGKSDRKNGGGQRASFWNEN